MNPKMSKMRKNMVETDNYPSLRRWRWFTRQPQTDYRRRGKPAKPVKFKSRFFTGDGFKYISHFFPSPKSGFAHFSEAVCTLEYVSVFRRAFCCKNPTKSNKENIANSNLPSLAVVGYLHYWTIFRYALCYYFLHYPHAFFFCLACSLPARLHTHSSVGI